MGWDGDLLSALVEVVEGGGGRGGLWICGF